MPKGYVRDAKPRSDLPPPPRARPFAVGPPEGQAWFQRLPPGVQEEFRARWRETGVIEERRETFARTTLKRSMAQATAVFFVTETFCAVPSIWHILAALVVGPIVGAYWQRIGAGRFQCMTTSIGPYVLLRVAFVGELRNSWEVAIACIAAVLGFVFLMSLTALVGHAREQRRADDLEY